MRVETFIDDATAWVKLLRADSRFSAVAVLGHSEESLIGMLTTKQSGADAFVSVADELRKTLVSFLAKQLRELAAAAPAPQN